MSDQSDKELKAYLKIWFEPVKPNLSDMPIISGKKIAKKILEDIKKGNSWENYLS